MKKTRPVILAIIMATITGNAWAVEQFFGAGYGGKYQTNSYTLGLKFYRLALSFSIISNGDYNSNDLLDFPEVGSNVYVAHKNAIIDNTMGADVLFFRPFSPSSRFFMLYGAGAYLTTVCDVTTATGHGIMHCASPKTTTEGNLVAGVGKIVDESFSMWATASVMGGVQGILAFSF